MRVKRLLLAAGTIVLCHSSYGNPSPQLGQKPRPANSGNSLIPRSQKPSTIQLSAAQGWSVCPQKPEALAQETDRAFGWLKNTGAYVMLALKDKGGSGQSKCKIQIRDSKTFRVEYPFITVIKIEKKGYEPLLTRMTLIGDGQRLAYWREGKGFTDVSPLASAKISSSTPLALWPSAFPPLIFSALRGGTPFGNLISSVRAAGPAFTMKMEERRFDYRGQIMHEKQITIKKKDPKASPFLIQIIIDASHDLPVYIQTLSGPNEKNTRSISWTAAWAASKSGIFDPGAFVIPPAAKKNAKG